MVVLTLLLRDEADIVETQVRYHLAQGIDLVIATDHRSSDGSTEILQRFEAEGRLHLIREEVEHFDQAGWATRMARLAVHEFGADWVIHSDADEFWWPRHGTVPEVLAAVPPSVGVIRGFVRHFAPRPYDDRPFYERMVARARPVDDLQGLYYPQLHVAHRGCATARLSWGQHDVTGSGLGRLLRDWYPFEILHFPLRSAAQMARKYIAGRESEQLLKHEAGGGTWHWEAAHNLLRTLSPDELYAARVVDDLELETGLREGRFVMDTRLRDVLRGAVDGPRPANREEDADFYDELQIMEQMDAAKQLTTGAKALERRLVSIQELGGVR